MPRVTVFIGRDKGKALLVLAPDLVNAQQMVDASTHLHQVGFVSVRNAFTVQGPKTIEELLTLIEATSNKEQGHVLDGDGESPD